MKNLSVRFKITLWFSGIMIIIVTVTFATILFIDHSVMQKHIQDSLIETVENNVDEVEFFSGVDDGEKDYDKDLYIIYKDGYLEIDDDFLDEVNGIHTALYNKNGDLIYGTNSIIKETSKIRFSDKKLRSVKVDGVKYYIFDRMLDGDWVDGLWLRGIVSQNQNAEQITSVVHFSLIVLPALLLLSVFGGYLVAGKMLKPINKITEAALHISQGSDLKKRINLGEGRDELHRLANTFDEMFVRLDKAFQTEQQFTADASHELRTPMSVIMAQCEYTLEQERTKEEYVEDLKVIQRQGRKMSKLIEDMLCFARMEQNNGVYPMEMFSMTELVNEVCEDMALCKEKEITLEWKVQPEIEMYGSRILIARLLTNLVSNAYRYGKENGNIFVSLSREDKIYMKVSDDGMGIAKEHQDKIFERFYQADASHTSYGSGLGLAMVREISAFHKGDVQVISNLGQGSTFIVTFPLI